MDFEKQIKADRESLIFGIDRHIDIDHAGAHLLIEFRDYLLPDGFRNRRGGGFEVPDHLGHDHIGIPERPGQLHHRGIRPTAHGRAAPRQTRRTRQGKGFFSSVWGLG